MVMPDKGGKPMRRRDESEGAGQPAGEKKRQRRRQGEAGFTLVEIMVVVVIIGMLASLVGVSVIRYLERAKRQTAAAQIKNFMTALDTYYMDNSNYPTTAQGLEALVSMPTSSPVPRNYPRDGYLPSIPLDPWGNEYIYFSPGNGGQPYTIESYGADGLQGGEGENADVQSWNLAGDKGQ
jgi:general secretion pathway protein G